MAAARAVSAASSTAIGSLNRLAACLQSRRGRHNAVSCLSRCVSCVSCRSFCCRRTWCIPAQHITEIAMFGSSSSPDRHLACRSEGTLSVELSKGCITALPTNVHSTALVTLVVQMHLAMTGTQAATHAPVRGGPSRHHNGPRHVSLVEQEVGACSQHLGNPHWRHAGVITAIPAAAALHVRNVVACGTRAGPRWCVGGGERAWEVVREDRWRVWGRARTAGYTATAW